MSLRFLALSLVLVLISCNKKESDTDISEAGQQVGDIMASIDESGGSTGALAMLKSHDRIFARHFKLDMFLSRFPNMLIDRANATSCLAASTFSGCTADKITRTFGGCTIGYASLTGTVELIFADAGGNVCQMTANGHSITRVPNFTLTGPRGGTLTVQKTGAVGQRIQATDYAAEEFEFSNDGIRRILATSGAAVLFDFTTQTTSNIGITGKLRNGRRVSGGTLRVTNNVSSVTCDYSPSNLTWGATCNCATSGAWTGTCSDGKASSMTITGCGTADFTMSGSTTNLTFDRCYGI